MSASCVAWANVFMMLSTLVMMAPKGAQRQDSKQDKKEKAKKSSKEEEKKQPASVRLFGKSDTAPSVKTEQIMEGVNVKEVQAKDMSNFSTQMKNKVLSPEQAAVFQVYNSLGRFDEVKKGIVSRWLKDRSCKWISTFTVEKHESQLSKETELSGYCSRFEIAKATHMDPESNIFKDKILKNFESDTLWDESKQCQRAFAAAGEKRYFVESIGMLKQKVSETGTKETLIESSASSSSKTPMLMSQPEKTPEPNVKFENPDYTALVAKAKILTSALSHLFK